MKVESGIPYFEGTNPGNTKKYPWEKMLVGDSFFVPNGKVTTISPTASIRGQKDGKFFSCRTVEGGVRVWRLK